jgi:hypothetical protein
MLAFLLVATGCTTVTVYRSDPTTQLVSNEYFSVEFEPQRAQGYDYFNSFRFVLTNKTDKDIILDWSKTYYLRGGKKFGQWGWEEMTFDQLKEIKAQPLVTINAGDMLTDVIFPINLVGKQRSQEQLTGRRPEDRFVLGVVPEGQNGMELNIKHNGKVVKQRVTLTITSERYSK